MSCSTSLTERQQRELRHHNSDRSRHCRHALAISLSATTAAPFSGRVVFAQQMQERPRQRAPSRTAGTPHFPRLAGRYRGLDVDVQLICDTMTMRRLPQLWLLVIVMERRSGYRRLRRARAPLRPYEFYSSLDPPTSITSSISPPLFRPDIGMVAREKLERRARVRSRPAAPACRHPSPIRAKRSPSPATGFRITRRMPRASW